MGEWLHEENEVKEFIREGFSIIYTTSLFSASQLNPSILSWQAKLSEEEKESISGEVTEEEIKASLWSLKASKRRGRMGCMQGFSKDFGWW